MYDYGPILTRLKAAKTAAGLTNEQLAQKSGVSRGTLNKILTGDTKEPKLPAFMAIASALGVSADYLVYGRDVAAPDRPSLLEESLLKSFRVLNDEGQMNLVEYADTLVNSGKYSASQKKVESAS